ncbi:MAG: ParA family protein [Leptospirales bacterium]|nr:ParA family protein [Leptospirales bacterium]
MAVVISMINLKGGVGKTTCAVNLAATLSRLQQRVLLLDVDAQASASGLLLTDDTYRNLRKAGRTLPFVLRDFWESKDYAPSSAVFQKDFVKNPKTGVPLLPALQLIAGDSRMRKLDEPISKRRLTLPRLMNRIGNGFDYVICDLPPALGPVSLAFLLASNYYLVPVIPDKLSVMGLTDLVPSIHKYVIQHDSVEVYPQLLGVFMNRVASGNKTADQPLYMEEVKRIFSSGQFTKYGIPPEEGARIPLREMISDTVDIPYSASDRLPVCVRSDNNSKIADDFELLAKSVLDRILEKSQ